MLVREKLSYDYYINWEPKSNIYNKTDKDITNDLLIKMYNGYIVKLSEFIKELNKIKKNIKNPPLILCTLEYIAHIFRSIPYLDLSLIHI